MQDFKPHGYQERGIRWIIDHPAAGLFLPMGAGKTITTLAAIQELKYERFETDKVLIIGPKRVIEHTWPAEIDKWKQTKDLRYSVISGTPEKRRAAIRADADVYLIGKENTAWLVNEAGNSWKWDCLVIDELSTFKNHRSKRFTAIRTVLPKISRIIGLTGTPSPKGYPDLFSQIYILDRGKRLGRNITQFRENFLTPGRRSGYTIYDWKLQPGADKRIQEKISDICMSIDQAEYATLPDLQEIDIRIPMGDALEQYKAFKRELVMELDLETITAANAGVLCGKLAQFTSGAIYTETGETRLLHSHKLEALQDLMVSANGQSVLIFYWYKHEVERIKDALKGYTGALADDPGAFDKWNAGQLDYLLLQPCSAGHGLNLQAGGHIAVWYSLPNWNLELYSQATARIYRQGQTEKVTVYHLLAEGTLDADMLEAIRRKGSVQEDMIKALRI